MSESKKMLGYNGLSYLLLRLKNIFSGMFVNKTQKGEPNGIATLDANGRVPSEQLPAYGKDVLEYASIAEFPQVGVSEKIYIADDTEKIYRWAENAYEEISKGVELGETQDTAYRGDRGKTAYEHATAKGSAFESGLYKIATNSEGHITGATPVSKADITALGIPGQDTTYENATHETAGLMSAEDKTKLDGAGIGITGITMNGEPQTVVDGVANLGTVLREHQDISGKADKATDATAGNFAALTADGNILDSGSKASDFLTEHQDISGKADKDIGATVGNFAQFDASGNPVDSGHKHSDYITQHQDISGKADKVSGATNGHFAGLDGAGNLVDSGHKHSDYITQHQDISGKADKVSGATNGNFASLDSNGNLLDSGHKHSDYLTEHQDISGKLDASEKGEANGVAELDSAGKVPASQLPSFVDDVVEYPSLADFPATGEGGKIYIAIDTNKTYRWSGSAYVAISSDLALGETSSTAYRGDRGKAAYDHAQAKGSAYASGLYKIATNAEGHVSGATAVQKSDITALGIPGQDTTYNNATQSADGLMSSTDKTKLDGVAEGATANVGTVTGITMNGSAQTVAQDGTVDIGTVVTAHQDISGKADKADTVLDTTLSMGRKSGMTVGSHSTALGSDVTASGEYSHAEGYNTVSSGSGSHAEGKKTASGSRSYGNNSYGYGASGEASHSEGYNTTSKGSYSHTEGINTLAINNACHAEGHSSVSYGSYSHAEGCNTQAYGQNSHAEGYSSNATSSSYGARGKADHAEGYNTLANSGTSSSYYGAHAEGYTTKATGNASHAEGYYSNASQIATHAEGYYTAASGYYAHAEGDYTTASGNYTHAEGYYSNASGEASHAEGHQTTASGRFAHTEGYNTKANDGGLYNGVHAFGCYNIGFNRTQFKVTDETAVEWNPHKEYAPYSCAIKHIENGVTKYYVPHSYVPAYLDPSKDPQQYFWHYYGPNPPSGTDPETIPEWDKDTTYPNANTIVKMFINGKLHYFQNHQAVTTTYMPLTAGSYYHTQELNTLYSDYPMILEEVGNGTSTYDYARSNARTLDLYGNEYLMGDVYVRCNSDSTGGSKLAKVSELPDVSGKADKVSSATNGNFASLDSNGNLTDSGHKHSDYITSHQDISGKADKVSDATNGNFAGLNSSGNIIDSGHKASDFLTQHQDISGKADKDTDAVTGNFAQFDASGNPVDSGHKHSDYLTAHQDITGKADKVANATSGNFASLDSNGNLTDSGHKHSDYLTAHQDITGKADKVSAATSGNFAGLDANGNLTDSGSKASDFLTSHQDITGKADKVTNATDGNFATLDANGNLVDSGKKPSDFLEGMTFLSYGNSTWADFLEAYNGRKVVYCRASSNSNPATGSQTRLAFMAYVNNETTPTEVEFQYYRSINAHTVSQQGDQVFVYKLTSANTWTVTVREAKIKIAAGTNMTGSFASNTLTLNVDAMEGATSSSAGGAGVVPAPSAGEHTFFLRGDGAWADPPGGKLIVRNLDTVTNTSGSYTHTTVVSDATADMKPIKIELSNPSAFLDTITVTPADGSITLSCNSVKGTSTVRVSMMFEAASNALTSSEFDVLAGRIGTLGDLHTTAKTSLVAATNEVSEAIAELNPTSTNYEYSDTFKTYIGSTRDLYAIKSGKVCVVTGYFNLQSIPNSSNMIIASTGLSLKKEVFFPIVSSGGKTTRGAIRTNGNVQIESAFTDTNWQNFSVTVILA